METPADAGTEPRSGGGRRPRRRWLARTALVLGVILAVLGTYVVVSVLRSHTGRSLPRTVQSWPLGRIRLEFTVPNPVTDTGPGRDSVWLWFPSVTEHDQPPASYVPGQWNALHLPGPLGQLESSFSALRIRAREHVPPAQGRFPLIILQPGLGFSAPQYQSLAEDLAASGFVVDGITPTGSANVTVLRGRLVGSTQQGNPPDLGAHYGRPQAEGDRLVGSWAAAAVAVSGRLRQSKIISRHLDTATVYVGHSFGGAASLQACRDDASCRGAVDLDGTQFGAVVSKGLDKPLMLISSADSCITGSCPAGAADSPDNVRVARSLLQHSRGPAWCFSIAGTRHFNFSDYSGYYIAWPLRKLLALGAIDGAEATRTIDGAVIAFARYATTGRWQQTLRSMRSCS